MPLFNGQAQRPKDAKGPENVTSRFNRTGAKPGLLASDRLIKFPV